MTAPAPLRASLAEQLRGLRGDAPEALVDAVLERVEMPGGDVLRLRPRSFDAVREAEALAGAGRPTPYWASAWPSGYALARAVARERPAGSVLEIGCGLALPSVVAARGGAAVMAVDAAPEAVVYAAHNLAINDARGEVAVADWSDAAGLGGPWDLVLGADVLYLAANRDSLLRALPELTAPKGEVWLADPGRAGCREFLAAARSRWELRSAGDGDVRIHRLMRRR